MKSGKPDERSILSEWPIPRPRQWLKYVNEPQPNPSWLPFEEASPGGRLLARKAGPLELRHGFILGTPSDLAEDPKTRNERPK